MAKKKAKQKPMLDEARDAGAAAYWDDVPMNKCPYKKGSLFARAWLEGWDREAERVDIKEENECQ